MNRLINGDNEFANNELEPTDNYTPERALEEK